MTRIKAINGVMWAADILTGQSPFPYMKKGDKKPATAAGQDDGADFGAVLDAQTAKLKARRQGRGISRT